MESVRFGIVGTGGMGTGHCNTITKKVAEAELVAICDIKPEVANEVGEEFNVPFCTDYKELIDRDDVDAIIVATPHYFHPEIAVYAMEHGKPVISEKPIAVTVEAGDTMIEAAKRTGVPFGVMHQTRAEAAWRVAAQLVLDGRLGEIYRTLLVFATFRSQAYYNSAGWRATWAGEGGGVLINQAPHPIDRFTWLGGLPSRVTAITQTKNHKIEVEDVAMALLEYPNGGTGYIYCSTTEAPTSEIIELAGEKGKFQAVGDQIRFWEMPEGVKQFSDNSTEMWAHPPAVEVELEIPEAEEGHAAIIANFARHLMNGEPLIAPGIQGINTVEMINAVILSGATGEPVDVPVDRPRYEAFLGKLKETSVAKDTGPDKRVTDNVHH